MPTVAYVHPDIVALTEYEPVPGFGYLPIVAYLLLGKEPVLIDAGAGVHREGFLTSLRGVIDPADLRWLIITHADADHIGALPDLLALAPRARLVTNWVGTGKLSALMPPPVERIRWLNPGETLPLPDRHLQCLQLPMYDCPSSFGLYDEGTGACFVSDAFGGFVPGPGLTLAEVARHDRLQGMSTFCRANSPWLADVQPERYRARLSALADRQPRLLLSSHLPPVPAAAIGGVIERAGAFPQEGRLEMPCHDILEAALATGPV